MQSLFKQLYAHFELVGVHGEKISRHPGLASALSFAPQIIGVGVALIVSSGASVERDFVISYQVTY
jgi:hypothetical protein